MRTGCSGCVYKAARGGRKPRPGAPSCVQYLMSFSTCEISHRPHDAARPQSSFNALYIHSGFFQFADRSVFNQALQDTNFFTIYPQASGITIFIAFIECVCRVLHPFTLAACYQGYFTLDKEDKPDSGIYTYRCLIY